MVLQRSSIWCLAPFSSPSLSIGLMRNTNTTCVRVTNFSRDAMRQKLSSIKNLRLDFMPMLITDRTRWHYDGFPGTGQNAIAMADTAAEYPLDRNLHAADLKIRHSLGPIVTSTSYTDGHSGQLNERWSSVLPSRGTRLPHSYSLATAPHVPSCFYSNDSIDHWKTLLWNQTYTLHYQDIHPSLLFHVIAKSLFFFLVAEL